ncbi:MAG: hypothetical protein PPP56_04295 [Longimonas sp.]|uniref:hypothetical protein n=1 Tax=Longimonas sp. TaxID=2039626 RepID=UPI00335B1370
MISWTHIALGFLALFAGPAAMYARKGGTAHRRWGQVFAVSMGVVVVTAVPLAIASTNVFLLFVSGFSGYFVWTGVRALQHKPGGAGPARPDWIGTGSMLLVSMGLIVWGGWMQGQSTVASVALVFGSIGTALAGYDLYDLFAPASDPRAWFYTHLSRMLGGYIAAVTAFATTTLTMLPPLVRWLGPTAVGVAGIVWLTRSYRRRFNAPTSA